MGDSFRATHVVDITFGKGEIPTSTKLQQGFSQARDANRLIEKALGDLWNQGGSSRFNTEGYRNYLANLARVIGSAAVISPRVIASTYTVGSPYSDDLSAYAGLTDFYLKYAPTNGNLVSVGTSTSLVLAQEKTSKAACQTAGDYYIDGAHLFCVTPLDAGVTVTYACSAPGDTDFASGDGATVPGNRDFSRPEYNVIPDPMTTNWGSGATMLDIADGGDHWIITLPGTPSSTLGTHRPSDIAPAGGMNGSYRLPSVLLGLGTSEQIPPGFIYIWDTVYQTIVSGLTFTKQSTTELHATPKQYLSTGSTRYALITVGLPLSVAIDNLRGLLHQHKHKRIKDVGGGDTYADGAEISHSDLADLSELSFSASNPYSPIGSLTPDLPQSQIVGDDHNGYLHRMGSRQGVEGSAGFSRDNYDGAMFGPLLLAAKTIDAGGPPDWLHLNADSHGIMFGNVNGPYLYYNQSKDALAVENKDLSINLNIESQTGNITAAVGDFKHTTAKTRYKWILAEEFTFPDTGVNDWVYDTATTRPVLRADNLTAGVVHAYAPIDLPNGCTITEIGLYGWTDNTSGADPILTLTLERDFIIPPATGWPSFGIENTLTLSNHLGTAPNYSPTYQENTGLTIGIGTFSSYFWRFHVSIPALTATEHVALMAIRVTYTYDTISM